MKRWLTALMLCCLFVAPALASPRHATLTPVKAHRDKRVQRHKAHKAGKHKTPKRPRHHGV